MGFLSSQCVPNNTSLYPISFGQSSPLFTYLSEPKVPSSQRNYYFGEPPKFNFFLGGGPIKMAHCSQKKNLANKPFNE